MKAVFGVRHSIAQLDLHGRSFFSLEVSGDERVETISTNHLSISFVARNQSEVDDSLFASGDWVIGVVGKIFHGDYPHQPTLLAKLLAEFRKGESILLRESFGEFVLVIVDKAQNDVTILSDVLSIRPVFYHISEEQFVFGTDIWQLVSDDLVPRKLNLNALCSWFLLDHVIGNESLIEDLNRLAPASSVRVSHKGVTSEEYREFRVDRKRPKKADLLDSIESAVDDSCRMIAAREDRLNCFLSGGYDSRYLLCEFDKLGSRQHAYTVLFDSGEKLASRAVLDALGLDGVAVDVPGSMLDLHDGDPFYFAPWGFPAWKFVTEVPVRRFNLNDTLVDGLMGDELIRGYEYEVQVRSSIDQFGIGEGMLRNYIFSAPFVFQNRLAKRIQNRVKNQIEDYFEGKNDSIEKIAFQWLLFNRKSTCHTTNHIYNQKHAETVHPFVSSNLIDLRLRTDNNVFDSMLYKELFNRRFPAVAGIPHSTDLQVKGKDDHRFSWSLWRQLLPVISQVFRSTPDHVLDRRFIAPRLCAYGLGSANKLYLARQLWIFTKLSKRLEEEGIEVPWNEI